MCWQYYSIKKGAKGSKPFLSIFVLNVAETPVNVKHKREEMMSLEIEEYQWENIL